MVCFRVWIIGRVQGVGFRYYTCEQADKLGVQGWVRNCTDGSVEAYICGTSVQIDAMKTWLEHGPRWAHVDNIRFEKADCKEVVSGFIIR